MAAAGDAAAAEPPPQEQPPPELYGILPSKLVSPSPAMALRSSDDTAAGEGHVVKIS